MPSQTTRLDLPPASFWVLPAAIALLRMIPYLWSLVVEPPDGTAVLNIGYNPRDFLSYLAFIRQAASDGTFLWHDVFTTEPHEPRFILLFHWILGAISGVSGASPTTVLEMSRVPLTFAFFGVLWWFLRPLVPGSRDRLATCAVIGLSGGIEGLVRLFIADVPAAFNPALILQSTWPLFGWNTFQVLYNPLWIAALTIFLVVLRPILHPSGPQGWAELTQVAVGFFILYWVHPYSAIVVLAIVLTSPIVELLFDQPVNWRKYARVAGALTGALAVIGPIAWWQSQDAVYRAASGNVFGSLQLPVFWYPLTLGAVGIVAVRGARLLFASRDPHRFAIASWIVAVVLLHTSPLLNGYHFILYLHLPLCICAAPEVLKIFTSIRDSHRAARLKALGLLAALFVGFGLSTVEAVSDVRQRNLVPAAYREIVTSLATRPSGNALVPPALGNILPAYTGHRVWVGHWFLTPNYTEKTAQYRAMASGSVPADLRSVVSGQQIRYLVWPRDARDNILDALGSQVDSTVSFGTHDLFVLR